MAKAERVSVDDRLVCFARYSDSLCRTFFRHLHVVLAVFHWRVSVDCSSDRSQLRSRIKEPGLNSVAISTTRFLHVEFRKCRFSRFLLSVLKSVVAHEKEGRLLDGGSGIGTPP